MPRTWNRLIRVAASLCVACVPTAGLVATQPAPAAQLQHVASDEPLITIDFPGGTLREYADAIREAAAGRANIVIPEAAREIALPSLQLRDATVRAALGAVRFIVAGDKGTFDVLPLTDPGTSTPTFALSYWPPQPRAALQRAGSATSAPSETPVEAFSLAEIVAAPGHTIESTLDPIRAAFELAAQSGDAAPQLMVHKESKLLMVRGTTPQIAIVESVLHRIREHAREAIRRAAIEAKREQLQSIEQLIESRMDETRRRTESFHSIEFKLAFPPSQQPLSEEEVNSLRNRRRSDTDALAHLRYEVERLERDRDDLRAEILALSGVSGAMHGIPRQEIESLRNEIRQLREDIRGLAGRSSR